MNVLTKQKGDFRESLSPVRLFVAYVLLFTFLNGLFSGPFDPASPYPEDIAVSVGIMLAMSPAVLIAFLLCIWNFRRMPIFATVACGASLWLGWQIWEAYWPGFDTDFPGSFQLTGLLSEALIFAFPFLGAFAVRFFLERRKRRALPDL